MPAKNIMPTASVGQPGSGLCTTRCSINISIPKPKAAIDTNKPVIETSFSGITENPVKPEMPNLNNLKKPNLLLPTFLFLAVYGTPIDL